MPCSRTIQVQAIPFQKKSINLSRKHTSEPCASVCVCSHVLSHVHDRSLVHVPCSEEVIAHGYDENEAVDGNSPVLPIGISMCLPRGRTRRVAKVLAAGSNVRAFLRWKTGPV